MKLCLHLSYIAQNSFHFDKIFHRKFKIPISVCVSLRRPLVAILSIFAVLKLIFPFRLITDAYLRENKHLSLKSKCKTLLSKHKRQSDERKSLIKKLKLAKRVLLDIEHLVKLHEQNHGVLMNYFGGQAEVLGKLLSTFVGSKYEAPSLVVEAHPKLTQWFVNVHSVLEWSEKQLIAVGEKLWFHGYTGQDHEEVIEVDMSTLSEISQNLDKDDHFPSDVLKVLENQDSILQHTRQSVKELKTVLL